MKRRTIWLVAACCFVAGDGMAMQLRGALLSSFESGFGVSESLLGLVAPAGTLGFIVAVVAVGLVAGRIDLEHTLLVGVAVTVLSLLVVSIAPSYLLLLLALLVQGAGAGVFRALDRPLLSHLYPRRLGRVFTLYALAWAIGAVAGPLTASVAVRIADWRATYLFTSLWFLPVVAIVWRLEPPEWSEDSLDRAALRRLLDRSAIRNVLLAMVLVGGIEGTIFTWLPYYAGTFLDRSVANAALSVYLLAYVPGRYLYARGAESIGHLRLTLGTTLLAIPTLAVALAGTTVFAVLPAVFVVGLPLSASFPLLSAYGVEIAPEYSGPVSALTTAASYVGIAIVPSAVGVVASVTGIERAMRIPVGLAVVLATLTWWMRSRA